MTTIASNVQFTPADLLRLPDRNGYELVDGQLVERPASKELSRIGVNIPRLLGNEASRIGEAEVYGADLGYQCFPDAEKDVRKPDASVIRRERLAALAGDPGYMPIPADLAVEVISPNDLSREMNEKVEDYLAAGFRLVWVVDPGTRLVAVHRIDGSVSKIHADEEITGEVALQSFRCRVSEFFAGG